MSSFVPPLVRVYLLDDHDIVRRGLRDLLAPAADLEVVGDSGRLQTAVDEIIRLAPDVMLLDLHLQDGSGIEVCRRVRSVNPFVRGVILTAADDDDDALVATVLAGAAGYVVKVVGATDIALAVRRVGAGRPILDDRERNRARELVLLRASSLSHALTAAEIALIEHVVAGATDAELAARDERPVTEIESAVAALVARLVTGLSPARPLDLPARSGKHRRE